ncbi:ATP-grasp domain-containing protein [Anaerobacillus alkaliphilus]|uniref:ATP-grasp domain-containing protein n=1 Tax=Anaerobacillus alkaliphilus TaxID=1548597 RepID=A0A4Q0VQ80_9BACI|nr:ATP-grasp domain-containing protein [Anaerobacillus alkaliphilus]RXI98428.1 ATP-grasp domain-containing protein [Anaerobacillus alkaliphilus]
MKKTGWLIYNQEMSELNEGFISWFMEEAVQLDIKLHVLIKEDLSYGIANNDLFLLHQGEKIEYPDFVIMRNNDPLLSKQLENLGLKVFNTSFTSEISNHKGKTHQYLAGKGIPMLDTVFVRREEFRPQSIPFSYPIVVKEVAGKGGNEVFSASNQEELEQLLETITAKEIIIQKMGDVPGKDVRVFVVGNEIIAAILRYSDRDFRANYSLGGQARLYDLSENEKSLVYKVIEQFKGDIGFVGIDFLFNKDGSFVFNEIEDVAGSRTLYANSKVNIVKHYLEFVLKTIEC